MVRVPGVGFLHASCFEEGPKGTYTSTGRVRFNGIDFKPLAGDFKLIIDPAKAQLTLVGTAEVKVGSVVLWRSRQEQHSWQLRPPGAAKAQLVLDQLKERAAAKLKGFPLRGDVSFDFSPEGGGTVSAIVHVALQKPIPDVTGDATLSASNAYGLRLDNLSFRVPAAKLGPVSISDLEVKYDRREDAWEGKLTAMFPVRPRELTVKAGGRFVGGRFHSANASVSGLAIALGNPAVFLNDLDLAVSREPKFEGGVGLTAGPELTIKRKKLRLLGLKGTFLYDAPGGRPHFRLGGRVVVLTDWGHVQGFVEYFSDTATVKFGGDFSFPGKGFPIDTHGFSASGELSGAFKRRGFNVEGRARIRFEQEFCAVFCKTIKLEEGAEALVSDRGAAACHIGWPNVGLGVDWKDRDFKAFGNNCDLSPWRSLAFSSQAGGQTGSFTLTRGLAFEAFNVLGRGGTPPSVTIRGPQGQTASTRPDFSPVVGRDFFILQIPSQARTFIEVRRPAAGRWTITPNPGSAPITGYQRADPLPAPRIRARVSGSGVRRRLSWRIRPLRGQRVTFVEQGRRLTSLVVEGARQRGSVTFAPARGAGGRRTIVAEVEQNGLPRRNIVVTRYRAPRQAKPSRVRRLTIARRGRALRLSWRRAQRAQGYEVRASLTDGRRTINQLPARQRSLRLRNVDPATGANVSVRALNDLAGNGRASGTRLRAPARPLRLRGLPRSVRRGTLTFTGSAAKAGNMNVELLDPSGRLVRSARTHLRARRSRRVAIQLRGLTPGRHTALITYTLDGSAKPYTLSRRLTIR